MRVVVRSGARAARAAAWLGYSSAARVLLHIEALACSREARNDASRRALQRPHGGVACGCARVRAAQRARRGAFTRTIRENDTALKHTPTQTKVLGTARRLLPPAAKSDFHRGAAAVSAAVRELRSFVASRRRDYCDPLRCSDAERDAIEAEVGAAVRDCRERIDALTHAAPAAAAAAAEAAGSAGGSDGDVLAHHTGVVLILAERLAEAAGKFDRARAQRARLALEVRAARRSRAPPPAEPLSRPASAQVRVCRVVPCVRLCIMLSDVRVVVATRRSARTALAQQRWTTHAETQPHSSSRSRASSWR